MHRWPEHSQQLRHLHSHAPWRSNAQLGLVAGSRVSERTGVVAACSSSTNGRSGARWREISAASCFELATSLMSRASGPAKVFFVSSRRRITLRTCVDQTSPQSRVVAEYSGWRHLRRRHAHRLSAHLRVDKLQVQQAALPEVYFLHATQAHRNPSAMPIGAQ